MQEKFFVRILCMQNTDALCSATYKQCKFYVKADEMTGNRRDSKTSLEEAFGLLGTTV